MQLAYIDISKLCFLRWRLELFVSFHLQSILNTADKLVFMVRENQYKYGLDGSIPVLVNPVSSYAHHLFYLSDPSSTTIGEWLSEQSN